MAINDKIPPWWDFVMVGICRKAMMMMMKVDDDYDDGDGDNDGEHCGDDCDLVMKVLLVKEVMSCDVSPVMFHD